MTMLNGAKYRIKDQNVYSAANVADGSFATDALGAPLGTISGVPRKPTLGSSAVSVVTGHFRTSGDFIDRHFARDAPERRTLRAR